jgi:uncharacterized protein
MNELLQDLILVEHYKFIHNGTCVLMVVDNLDVFVLDEDIYHIINEISPKRSKTDINELYRKFGKEQVDAGIDALKEVAVLKKKDHVTSGNFENELSQDVIDKLDIVVSQQCNLACKYCFTPESNGTNVNPGLLSVQVAKKSIDFLLQRSGNKQDIFVCFFGGEPLINFEVIKTTVWYALKECKKLNKSIHFSMTTNGTLLNDEVIEFIKNYRIKLQISLDGDSYSQNLNRPYVDGSETYSAIVNNLKKLECRKLKYSARATISKLTINSITSNFEHLVKLGFSNIHFESAFGSKGGIFINDKTEIEQIQKQYFAIAKKIIENYRTDELSNFTTLTDPLSKIASAKKVNYSCGIGRGYVSVDVNGNIFLCHRLVGHQKFHMGNVMEDTFSTIWFEFIKNRMNVNERKTCKKCWARYICGGGCYAINYESNNDITIPTAAYCHLKKHSIKMALIIYLSVTKQNCN